MQAYGYDTVVGYGEEVAYGTRVAPTSFLEALQENMALTQNAVKKPTLARAGVKYYTPSKRAAGGAIQHCVPYQGMEMLLKHLTGGTPISTQVGATLVYNHKFVNADDMLTALSVYVGRDANAIGSAFAYPGSQIAAVTFTQEVEGFLLANVEMASRDEEEVAEDPATWPTGPAPQWHEVTTMQLSDGTPIAVDASLAEFKLGNPLADDRYKLGDRLRKGLGRGAVREVSGKIALEFDKLDEYRYFSQLKESAITFEWTGPLADVGNAEPYKFKINVPRAVFSGTTPSAADHGPLAFEMPFDAFIGTGDEDEITFEVNNLLTAIP